MTNIEKINSALSKVSQVTSLSLIFDRDLSCYDLELELEKISDPKVRCIVRFHNVGELSANLGLGGMDQLHALGFWDPPQLWFDRPLRVSQLEYGNFRFSCKGATLVAEP